MVPYFGITDDPADRTLLGYAWKSQPYGQVTKADERLDVTSICMLPKGLQRLSLACHCDPLVLSRAIASLDGMQDVPGLNMVFDEMKRARPSSITAPAYYEAKVTEAAAMLLDWSLANARGASSWATPTSAWPRSPPGWASRARAASRRPSRSASAPPRRSSARCGPPAGAPASARPSHAVSLRTCADQRAASGTLHVSRAFPSRRRPPQPRRARSCDVRSPKSMSSWRPCVPVLT